MTDPVTQVCRALAHPTRRAVLRTLLVEECVVGELARGCGEDQPVVSKHLATLRDAGLVRVRVDGRCRCYKLTDPELVASMLEKLDEAGQQLGDATKVHAVSD